MLTGFSDKQIISLLSVHSLWTKRACREILRRKNDFVPQLIDILDEAVNDPDPFMFDEADHHIPAAFLLAQMREPQAYPRLVSLICYDQDDVDMLWGDLLTDNYVEILRDTYNGDSSLLPKLIENRSVGPFARAMAVKAWGMHYFDGHISREEITGYFRHLIHEVYAGEPSDDDEIVLSYIANCIREQQLEELIDDVKAIYERGGIDEIICEGCEEYEAQFNNPLFMASDLHIDNAIQILENWDWFKEDKSSEKPAKPDSYDDDYDDDDDGDDGQPPELTKIGRNEPCPCGSGKKYKNCCQGKGVF